MKLIIEKIYCLYSPQFPLRGKVGISGNVEQRRACIEQEIQYKHGGNVRVRCLLKVPIVTSAYSFEQALHRAFDRLYFACETMKGTTGHSEWYWSVNWFSGLLAYLYCFAHNWQCAPTVGIIALLFPFFPLDLALCVVLLAAAEYAIVGGAVYLIYNYFN